MSQDTTGDHQISHGMPSDFSDAIFARRLRSIREIAGLTQRQLADMMTATGTKMHATAIAKIESYDRSVTIGEAVQLAEIIGVPLMAFFVNPDSNEIDDLIDAMATVRVAVRKVIEAQAALSAATENRDSAMNKARNAIARIKAVAEDLNNYENGKEYLRMFDSELQWVMGIEI